MKRKWRWVTLAVLSVSFVVIVVNQGWWQVALRYLFPAESPVLYPGATLLSLVGQHVKLVLISSGITVVGGVPLGVWVTRRSGRPFLPVVSAATSFGQTFPPIAVLALAIPMLGFGATATIIALILYGLLPVVRNTIAGVNSVPASTLEAARGMGMSSLQTLLNVEIPIALPIIMTGIRISVIINIGTAMIGAVVGAGGLGAPIISGLVLDNLAFILEGAIPAAALALLANLLLSNAEAALSHGA